MKRGKEIIVTTPDYPPHKLGGLATLSQTIVHELNAQNISTDVKIWSKSHELRSLTAQHVLNIHSWPIMFWNKTQLNRCVNFVHGSELIPYSKNILIRLLKKNVWGRYLRALEQSRRNIFISNYTLELAQEFGFKVNYARDIVFPNKTPDNGQSFVSKKINEEIVLCCFARNVPHKNIDGTIRFAEYLQGVSNKKVTLYLNANMKSEKIKIISDDFDDRKRNKIYLESHFNLLFSLDHKNRGNVEGFGLTPLEAALYSTPSIVLENGGLPESVHHRETGWVLKEISIESVETWWKQIENYEEIAKQAFTHTKNDHLSDDYKKIVKELYL